MSKSACQLAGLEELRAPSGPWVRPRSLAIACSPWLALHALGSGKMELSWDSGEATQRSWQTLILAIWGLGRQ